MQNSRTINQSMAVEQELRAKLEILEPKTRRVEELIQENKQIKQGREEKNMRIKALERTEKELKTRLQDMTQSFEEIKS